MDDIITWLNSRAKDYAAGVQLYIKYGRDAALLTLFTREAQSEFKQRRLLQALKEILNPPPAATALSVYYTPKPVSRPVITPFLVAHKGWPNPITDPVLQALYDQWRPLYAELMNAQARVYDVALQAENGNTSKEMEACQLAHRIIDLDNRLDDLYARRDHYLVHGHLPFSDEKKEPIGDPVRWATERQNAMRYIREYRSKIAKDPANKLVPKWQQKILDFESDVEKFNKLLKLDDE